jgi:DNA-directed RNA polymerase subunit N (RpoN/RPB10)
MAENVPITKGIRLFSCGRAVRKEYGSHWTLYIRLGRWVLEVNAGRDKA